MYTFLILLYRFYYTVHCNLLDHTFPISHPGFKYVHLVQITFDYNGLGIKATYYF